MNVTRAWARLVCALVVALASTSAEAAEKPAEPVRLDAWQLLPDPAGTLTASTLPVDGWRPAQAGRSWNAQFDDLRDYFGVAWYKASFTVLPSKAERHVLLHFGAVDYTAEVFVNGERVGTHEGAYTPFTVDVTGRARSGANEVLVRVVDPPPTPPGVTARFPDMPYEELPRGKQNWYIENAGLWQPVTLDVRPALYIERVHVTPKNAGDVSVEVTLAGAGLARPGSLHVELLGPDGALSAALSATTVKAPGAITVTGSVPRPSLWSPASPALYSAVVWIAGSVSDRVTARFGFRELTTKDGQFFLNGEPFYMRAALDQDFYPESIYSTPDKAYVVDAMKKGRQLGLNLLRCHIKVCDPTYLDAADEVGMLVWYEVPSWDRWTDASVARGHRIFDDMVARDWNHPSIVIQSLINEAWGIDMTKADQRAGLSRWFDEAKTRTAPLGRLIVDNSACCENFHVRSDIDDFHQYFSIPDNAAQWDKWVADFASRPAWSYSPHGDAVRTRNEPLVVSEFGNWGLPALPDPLPWWFPRDFNGIAITRPAGLFDRFSQFGFDRVFKNYGALAREAQWRQFRSLKHEIENIRSHEPIRGYVITEFTDINWEANGLMDMWRRPKAYAAELADIQQDDVLLPEVDRTAVTSGEQVHVSVALSRYGAVDPAGGTLDWSATNGLPHATFFIHDPVARGTVARIASFALTAPAVTQPTTVRVGLQLSKEGKLLARNFVDVAVYPPAAEPPSGVRVYDAFGALGMLPWKPGALEQGATIVSPVLDAQLRRFVEAGGRALIVPRGVIFSFAATPGLSAVSRRDQLDGNWVSNFPWMNPASPAFTAAAIGPMTGGEAAAATPRWLLDGVPAAAWRAGDVLSGMFYGWLNENRATTAQFKIGKGKVIVTTFDVASYGKDPFATRLVNGMLTYLASDACAPATALP